MRQTITAVAAYMQYDGKPVIGSEGKIPWACKEDMTAFANLTAGGVCIMGRKTYESLPIVQRSGARWPTRLPGRKLYVVTSDPRSLRGAVPVSSIEQAIEIARSVWFDRNIFIIGGKTIYEDALTRKLVDEVVLTEISIPVPRNHDIPNPVHFPLDALKGYTLRKCERESYGRIEHYYA